MIIRLSRDQFNLTFKAFPELSFYLHKGEGTAWIHVHKYLEIEF